MNIDQLRSYPFKGFMAYEEALRLYELALEAGRLGPCLEIGSYCGRSAAYLGMGCKKNGAVLYTIDHHRGSEEQQPGQPYFDPDLVDRETGRIDTFRFLITVIADLSLEDIVVPIIARSETVSASWKIPLALVFIDGGHTFEAAFADYTGWVSHILSGGYLVIHDIFPDASRGGQAPRCIYEMALSSGLFLEMPMLKSLGILKRTSAVEISDTAMRKWREMGP